MNEKNYLGLDGIKWAKEMEKYGISCADKLIPWTCNMIEVVKDISYKQALSEFQNDIKDLRRRNQRLTLALMQIQMIMKRQDVVNDLIEEVLQEMEE